MTRQEIISKCVELEKEYDSTPNPRLNPTSVEDVDDLYQAKLEYNWWLEEVKEEYIDLAQKLGYLNVDVTNRQKRVSLRLKQDKRRLDKLKNSDVYQYRTSQH